MWVQTFIRASLVTLLIASFQSCDEDDQPVCNFENPLEELSWLNEIKEGFEISQQAAASQIVMYTYQGQQVFLVEPCVNCADGLTTVYDCEGEVICEFGGIAGVNTCEGFEGEATSPQILFSNLCEQLVIPDQELYEQESDFVNIISATITGDCLNIEFSSSGCSGDSWTYQLADAEVILESFPIQRNIKFLLDNQEACAAVFTRTASFDLRPLQEASYSEIKLNLTGYEQQLSYRY